MSYCGECTDFLVALLIIFIVQVDAWGLNSATEVHNIGEQLFISRRTSGTAEHYDGIGLPHIQQGYRLEKNKNENKQREGSHKHVFAPRSNTNRRRLGSTFDFLESTVCGSSLVDLQSMYDGFYGSMQHGVIANACFQCSNSALASVASCYYRVSLSGEDLSLEFTTYTDTACSIGAMIRSTITHTAGVCTSGGYSMALHVGVSDVTMQFNLDPSGTGMAYIDYSDSTCSTPMAYKAMDINLGRCYGENLDTTVDRCERARVTISSYSESGCAGTVTVTESPLPTCEISDSGELGQWERDDDHTGGDTRNSGHAADQIVCFPANESISMNLMVIMALVAIASVLVLVVLGALAWFRNSTPSTKAVAPAPGTNENEGSVNEVPEWMQSMDKKERKKSLKILRRLSIDPSELDMGSIEDAEGGAGEVVKDGKQLDMGSIEDAEGGAGEVVKDGKEQRSRKERKRSLKKANSVLPEEQGGGI